MIIGRSIEGRRIFDVCIRLDEKRIKSLSAINSAILSRSFSVNERSNKRVVSILGMADYRLRAAAQRWPIQTAPRQRTIEKMTFAAARSQSPSMVRFKVCRLKEENVV